MKHTHRDRPIQEQNKRHYHLQLTTPPPQTHLLNSTPPQRGPAGQPQPETAFVEEEDRTINQVFIGSFLHSPNSTSQSQTKHQLKRFASDIQTTFEAHIWQHSSNGTGLQMTYSSFSQKPQRKSSLRTASPRANPETTEQISSSSASTHTFILWARTRSRHSALHPRFVLA